MADAVTQRVLQQYPSFAFLLNDPEIGPLLRDAVDPNKGFSSQTFFAKIQQTHWWRRQSEAQRTWATQVATDPGEANEQRRGMRAAFGSLAASMGAQLTTAQVNFLSELMLQHGQDPNGPEARAAIAKLARLTPNLRYKYGSFQTATKAVEALSEREFFMKISNVDASKYARRIIQGIMTLDDVRSAMQQLAVKRYPHMRELLIDGMTPGEIIAPYRQIVADELELGDPGRVDVKGNATWRQLLGIRDPKSHKVRLPTESEVVKMARSQTKWWDTAKGQEADNSMALNLLNELGVRKSA